MMVQVRVLLSFADTPTVLQPDSITQSSHNSGIVHHRMSEIKKRREKVSQKDGMSDSGQN